MDQELKQRLIGAVVITALAAIFVPMLFDDDVDQTGKTINELTIPEVPAKAQDVEIMPLPEKAEDVATVIPVEKSVSNNSNSKPASVLEEGVAEAIAAQPQPIRQPTPMPAAGKSAEKPLDKSVAKNKPGQTFEGDADMPQTALIAEDELPVKPANKPSKPVPVAPAVANVVPAPTKPVVKPMTPQPAPPKSVAPPAPEGATRWYLNAGSFTQRANANALQENLKQQGFAASIKETQGEKGSVFKVRIGPMQDKAKAQEVKNRLMQINVNTFFAAEE